MKNNEKIYLIYLPLLLFCLSLFYVLVLAQNLTEYQTTTHHLLRKCCPSSSKNMESKKLPTDDEYLKGVNCDCLEEAFNPISDSNFKDAVAAMIQIYAYHGDSFEFKHLSEMIGTYLRII